MSESTGRKIATLKRRLVYLDRRMMTNGGSSHDIAEMGALAWAIRVCENAYRLGIHTELGRHSAIELRVVEGIAADMTLDAIADELELDPLVVKETAGRLCRRYHCTLYELPAVIATFRGKAA